MTNNEHPYPTLDRVASPAVLKAAANGIPRTLQHAINPFKAVMRRADAEAAMAEGERVLIASSGLSLDRATLWQVEAIVGVTDYKGTPLAVCELSMRTGPVEDAARKVAFAAERAEEERIAAERGKRLRGEYPKRGTTFDLDDLTNRVAAVLDDGVEAWAELAMDLYDEAKTRGDLGDIVWAFVRQELLERLPHVPTVADHIADIARVTCIARVAGTLQSTSLADPPLTDSAIAERAQAPRDGVPGPDDDPKVVARRERSTFEDDISSGYYRVLEYQGVQNAVEWLAEDRPERLAEVVREVRDAGKPRFLKGRFDKWHVVAPIDAVEWGTVEVLRRDGEEALIETLNRPVVPIGDGLALVV